MSNIQGVGQPNNVNRVQTPATVPTAKAAAPQTPARAADRVELSNVNGLLAKLKTNDVRADKVQDVRAQIDAGTYETDDKLNGAIDKLIDDLA